DVEPGLAQKTRQRAKAIRIAAMRLTDDESVAHAVTHESRFRNRARQVNDAAHDTARGYRFGNTTAWIDGAQLHALVIATEAIEEPPRYAVHRGKHDCALIEQRLDTLCNGSDRRRLHRHDHPALGSD